MEEEDDDNDDSSSCCCCGGGDLELQSEGGGDGEVRGDEEKQGLEVEIEGGR